MPGAGLRVGPAPGPRPTLDRAAPAEAEARAAEPPGEPPAQDGDGDGDGVTSIEVAGIPVLVRQVPGAEAVTTTLFIRGGAHNGAETDAGIEALALALLKLALKGDAAQRWNLGVEFQTEVAEDLSLVSGRGPAARWAPMLDRILEMFVATPTSEAYVKLARDIQVLRLHPDARDPAANLEWPIRRAVFKGHRDAHPLEGTAEVVAGLTAPAVAAHLAKLRERRRLLVVAVGDVEVAAVAALVERRLGALTEGSFAADAAAPPRFAQPTTTVIPSVGPVGFLARVFPAPNWSDRAFATALVAAEALEAALFQELRERRGLSYYQTVQVDTTWRWPVGRLTVASQDLPAASALVQAEIERLKAASLSDRELRGFQQGALARFHRERATTSAIARTLGAVHIRTGDWRWSRVAGRIRAVSAADLQAYARTHLVNLQTVILADPARVDGRRF